VQATRTTNFFFCQQRNGGTRLCGTSKTNVGGPGWGGRRGAQSWRNVRAAEADNSTAYLPPIPQQVEPALRRMAKREQRSYAVGLLVAAITLWCVSGP